MKAKNIGYGIKGSEKECSDRHCPFHGNLPVKSKTLVGKVTNDKNHISPTVEWESSKYIAKYERFKKAKVKVKVHNPPCVDAKLGNKVKIAECRPISKTKNFVIVEVLG